MGINGIDMNKKNEKDYYFSWILFSILLLAPCCTSTNIISNSTKDSIIPQENNGNQIYNNEYYVDSVSMINNAMSIIDGNHDEYIRFHSAYVNAIMNGEITQKMLHDGLLYSFIMAERYHDTLAAYDFVSILEYSGCHIDSSISSLIVNFLEMVAKFKPDPISFLATKKLYDIYYDGKYGIERNEQKAKYYNELCDSIAQSIHR